ncbi:MAG TPA: hypothetical protein VNG93_06610 [Candidatus Dormibacteraeota bacterium]|nr:hypothetical protein [Candidatus Dormibacteraeota bacterium]
MVVAHPDVRSLARVTLSDFFVVLVLSLITLAPAQTPGDFTLELVLVAVISLVDGPAGARRPSQPSFTHAVAASADHSLRAQRPRLPAVGAVGAALFHGTDEGESLQLLMGIVLVLLLVGVRNTWDLLVTVADKSPG